MEDYTTLILVILIVLAFVCSRLLHDVAERRGLVSGIEYAVVGALIGPVMPWSGGLITEETLHSLDLLISLLLGLLGFMVGLHARVALRRFEHFLAGSFAALLVAGTVALAVLGLVQWIDISYLNVETPLIEYAVYADDSRIYELWAAEEALWLALTLGAAAAIASTTAINATVQRWRAEGQPVVLLRDLASAGQVVAILLFGIALSGDRAVDTADSYSLSLVEWSMAIGFTGALTGLLFMIFIGGEGEQDELRLYLATIGVVIFAAGIGAALGVSPLFVNMIAGLVVAATSVHGDRLRTNLDQLRRPVAVLIMVFAGIAWRPVSGWMWLIPAVYLALRVSTRLWASRWAVSTFVHGVELRSVGGGLIGQGSLAAAIALSYAQGHPERGPIVLSAVLLPMFVTDLFTVPTLRRVLANAGAIRPRAKIEPLEPDAADQAEPESHEPEPANEPESPPSETSEPESPVASEPESPVASEPTAVESAASESESPVASEPTASEPIAVESTASEPESPVASEPESPVASEPIAVESAASEPTAASNAGESAPEAPAASLPPAAAAAEAAAAPAEPEPKPASLFAPPAQPKSEKPQ